jgi:hypothetical protein
MSGKIERRGTNAVVHILQYRKVSVDEIATEVSGNERCKWFTTKRKIFCSSGIIKVVDRLTKSSEKHGNQAEYEIC